MTDNIDILLKLFDTLKEESKKNDESTNKLINQQHDLIGYIEHLPIKELQDALKEHNKKSLDNIDTCTEKVEEKTDTILNKVKGIESKIGKMILVVIVAFSFLSIAYLVGRYGIDTEHKFQKFEQKIEEKRKANDLKLKETIEQMIKDIRKK